MHQRRTRSCGQETTHCLVPRGLAAGRRAYPPTPLPDLLPGGRIVTGGTAGHFQNPQRHDGLLGDMHGLIGDVHGLVYLQELTTG